MQSPEELVYNPNGPIETIDLIIADECHRSIYNLWRQALEYFDAYLFGLTATPSKQTIGFFNKKPLKVFSILKLTPRFSYFRFPLQVRYNTLA